MRALLWQAPFLHSVNHRGDPELPTERRRILGQAIAARVIEALSTLGVPDITLLCAGDPDGLRAILGAGERWGVRLRYQTPEALDAETVSGAEPWIVGRLDLLPTALSKLSGPVALVEGGLGEWLGWGHCSPDRLTEVIEAWAEDELSPPAFLKAVKSGKLFDTRSWPSALASNRRALRSPEVLEASCLEEVQPGVWAEPEVEIGANVRFEAPVFLGRGATVEAGCLVRDAVIGEGAWVSKGTRVTRALIERKSFVGPDLELRDLIVRGASVLDPRRGLRLDCDDPNMFRRCPGLRSRARLLMDSFQRPSTAEPLDLEAVRRQIARVRQSTQEART